jgi:hypothetical protein
MPVAARTKVVIEESCLRAPSLTFTYKGPNPQDIYKKVKKLLPTIFKVDEHDIEEREFLWDRSTAEEKFKTVLNFIKEFDPTSYMEVQISLEGFAKPSKEFGREGEATITVEAKFRVEYPQETFWQRSIFFNIYQKLIGKSEKERKEYKHKCLELVNLFCDELRSYLNILATG